LTRLLVALIAAVGATVIISTVYATHFRSGHYFWSPAGGNAVTVTLQDSFRRNANPCVNNTGTTQVACTGPGGLAGVGDIIVEVTGGTTFNWGDGSPAVGSPAGPLMFVVTSIDASQNWLFGLALDPTSLPAIDTTISHTYAAPGNYTAFSASCCRASALDGTSAHINNPDGNYSVGTVINAGSTNRPPVSALPPIVQCPIGALCSFAIPAADADGDDITFRLATAAEAGAGVFIQPGPPHAANAAAIDANSGLYTWDTTGATVGPAGTATFYSTQVILEDRDALGVLKSATAVDFFIQLVETPNAAPVFVFPPTPACGSSITDQAGDTIAFAVQATDPDGDTVTLNGVGLPGGSTMTPLLPVIGTPPVSSAFSWTPTVADNGVHVITFSATATGGSALCSVTLVVEEATPPTPTSTPDDEATPRSTRTAASTRTTTPPPRTTTPRPRTPTPAPVTCADVNGDGRVTLRDVALVARHIHRRYNAKYDITNDGRVTMRDVHKTADQVGRRCNR
jgi:hypothetical protein